MLRLETLRLLSVNVGAPHEIEKSRGRPVISSPDAETMTEMVRAVKKEQP